VSTAIGQSNNENARGSEQTENQDQPSDQDQTGIPREDNDFQTQRDPRQDQTGAPYQNQQPQGIRRDGQPGLGVIVTYSNGQGVHVDQVLPNSPAERAGIRAGDFILAVNENRVTSPEALIATVTNMDPQDRAAITIGRGGQEEKVDVVLSTREEVFSSRTTAFRGPLNGQPLQEDLRAEIQRLQQQVREIQDRLRELENRQSSRSEG
jgi:C-terminal processing protease CtpA/Prc